MSDVLMLWEPFERFSSAKNPNSNAISVFSDTDLLDVPYKELASSVSFRYLKRGARRV